MYCRLVELIFLSVIIEMCAVLDELEEGGDSSSAAEALKTRSLPAFLRPRPRPLSTDADLHQLYAKVAKYI